MYAISEFEISVRMEKPLGFFVQDLVKMRFFVQSRGGEGFISLPTFLRTCVAPGVIRMLGERIRSPILLSWHGFEHPCWFGSEWSAGVVVRLRRSSRGQRLFVSTPPLRLRLSPAEPVFLCTLLTSALLRYRGIRAVPAPAPLFRLPALFLRPEALLLADNPEYQEAASSFLDLCRRTIGPAVSPADVREMLLQHILTKDIFLSIFREDQFHRENNVARQLDGLEGTFFTGDVRRQAIDRLRAYYGVIGRAADEIADYAEKQQFLKAIYEDFYTAYNPAAADRLGVVYTPNEVVDFIIRGADHLLQKHFGKTLADDNVQILDPATGTGTFVTNLINHLPADRLEHKYLNEIHANEVAILPYYIANLNIEYTYQQRTGRYLEFPNLCFVDTLDNLDWQQQGATGGAVTRQGSFNLGGLSEENWIRIQEQNEKPISVIIGNPPYNANQQNENDNNKNREYPAIDRRIRETYIASSTAQKTKQSDVTVQT